MRKILLLALVHDCLTIDIAIKKKNYNDCNDDKNNCKVTKEVR